MHLAALLNGLKRQNPVYYQSLVTALQGCVDPEHLLLVNAPAETIMRQQGRVAFGLELMEVVIRAEQIASGQTSHEPLRPPMTLTKDTWHA